MKNKKSKNRIITFIQLILLLIFLLAAINVGRILYSYHEGDSFYDNSRNRYTDEADYAQQIIAKNAETGITVDIDSLKKENPDIKGWIVIPETNVSYPLLWSGSDQKYLRTTYTGEYSIFGSIFISKDCSSDLSDRHTVIYGHNTKNGSMFGSLKNYKTADYRQAHPFVYIIMDGYTCKYEIFSAFTVETSDSVYTLTFVDDESYKDWQRKIASRSIVKDIGWYEPQGTEKILTLSTCTSRTKTERFVVNARLVDYWENGL